MANPTTESSTVKVNRDQFEPVAGKIIFARRASDEKGPEVVLSSFDLLGLGYDVTIRNARPIVNELSLDREGFTLIKHKVSCAKEHDPEIMRDRYLKEMVPFIKNYFNASWVVPRRSGVILRSAGGGPIPRVLKPDGLAHIDYAPIAGPMLAAIEDESQSIPSRAYSRLMIIQTWHAFSPPPQDFPLAFCDGRSVDDADIVVVEGRTFLNTPLRLCLAHFNPAHRWYYFPEMTADEFILFKGYDSEVHCNPKAVHAAFDNRRAFPNAKPRESLEARFFVYYA
ncbi:hypothetical protein IVB45_06035 [Bradyrhizobium sp. 4]|uniref:CmcJ/NvfI family oxidoreductase n=1 Tax=unclassified Bradyrhizobium TaxID=2631580 RepID=UPI001FFB1813|nr:MULTISPECIES: CmcJ/NvfI family oxidoreductase [unclassified Bradyrhizobium]MCK1400012.1 hypothetical protein [Bradyrhizobium sp. 39]MCK1635978.1 hypothetical protein [Bradyrhizobium sp. 162]MCK1751409.1 hypothetical protein [Bradyrhizobium sp. 135]UPJ36454.1 hypothetical protein IVB45_06035 [Bradyrhizobium sp. 4]